MTREQADQEPDRHNVLLSCLKDLWVVDNSTCSPAPVCHGLPADQWLTLSQCALTYSWSHAA